MKKNLFSVLLAALSICFLKGQSHNAELQKLASEVNVDLIENILPFWSEKMIDVQNGGFYGRMDGNNRLYEEAEKGGILNARILWTFSSAFRVLKDSSYLKTARYSFNYILDKFVDRENGGTFRSVTAKGLPSDTRKQTYSQAFFIYALAEYYLATGDKEALEEAKKIFYCLERFCFDAENNGYFEVYSSDWKKTNDLLIGEKSIADQKTMNTHLHLLEAYINLYRAWPDKIVAGRLKNMISLFLDKIIDPETGHLIVFMNERWVPTSTVHSYGHDIEASWLLHEAANVLGNKKIISKVENKMIPIVNAAMEGFQPDGSLVTEKDVEAGHVNTNRDWWPQAETVVGMVNAFELTADTGYLNKATRCWEYIDKNLVDHQDGEWFNSVSASGEINRWGDKAGFWKCPYHNGRMCLEIIRRSGYRLPVTGYREQENGFRLNESEYFENVGVNVMAFQDIYPEGHQGGVAIIMHGMRLATNGDLRLDETPGQWQPIPKQKKRLVDKAGNIITVNLTYPDSTINGKGFNPVTYPDLYFNYTVKTRAEAGSIIVTVNLDRPVPEEFIGKVGFNMELFPGWLFGKTWSMDKRSGIFPQQPNGPGYFDSNGNLSAAMPMAEGKVLVVAPEDELLRLTIRSQKENLQLIDGRYTHNNGWFVVRSLVPAGATSNAVEWIITPNIVPNWIGTPVIHVSQIGYHPDQQKIAFIELDNNNTKRENIELVKIGEDGSRHLVISVKPDEPVKFLRYNYINIDFSSVKEEGMYMVKYGSGYSNPFRIASNVYDRNVWQPTLEYFLPVQMCHMRINEKYRVWHGLCHMDDALMAPVNHNHFDGYMQGASTLTKYRSGEHVPGLNIGGWHDAGDYDLRVESQSGEVYILVQAYEAFNIKYDETSIDQHSRIVEIHQPDGKPDILQQIEHGALSVVGGYRNLGRLYKGIICPTLRQYVLLGDGINMTDGHIYNGTDSKPKDDRWVFTEDNPGRELTTAAHMAAASRVLKGFNDTLSKQCMEVAEGIFNLDRQVSGRTATSKLHAASELWQTTGKLVYKAYLLSNEALIVKEFRSIGWLISGTLINAGSDELIQSLRKAATAFSEEIRKQGAQTPFGVPYRPNIWGAGWDIQSFGVRQYYLHKSFPDIFPADYMFNALNFILGVHPGSNTSSFASGVGARSTIVAYGVNRADWSYIPGGVSSGTALIRPDYPELLDWPYLWQQQEYVMGGGATNFMFLVLAADKLLEEQKR